MKPIKINVKSVRADGNDPRGDLLFNNVIIYSDQICQIRGSASLLDLRQEQRRRGGGLLGLDLSDDGVDGRFIIQQPKEEKEQSGR